MAAPKRKAQTESTKYPGVYRYHTRACKWREGGRCDCESTWQATVYLKRERRLIRKHFDLQGEARSWRADAQQAIKGGKLNTPNRTTVAKALDAYLAGMADGTILDRSGKPYKPATCRSYKRAAERRLIPALGSYRLDELRRRDVQDLVDRLRAQATSPSTIHNTLDPLRAVYRRAVRRDDVVVDPTDGLELPAIRGRRDRTAAPSEAEALIAALPGAEQALWAMAIYVGPRRGELQELRWTDLDLKASVGSIERAWDDEGRQVVDVKSEAGAHLFPIVEPDAELHERRLSRRATFLPSGERNIPLDLSAAESGYGGPVTGFSPTQHQRAIANAFSRNAQLLGRQGTLQKLNEKAAIRFEEPRVGQFVAHVAARQAEFGRGIVEAFRLGRFSVATGLVWSAPCAC